jgi:hypothetical protein
MPPSRRQARNDIIEVVLHVEQAATSCAYSAWKTSVGSPNTSYMSS